MQILQLNEVRKAYFLETFDRDIENMQIISFGRCNYNCPYCKRDGQFKGADGNIIHAYDVTMDEVKKVIDVAVSKGRRIRLSGGDPCCFIKQSLEIAKYVMDKHNQKISIAHNGSSIKLIKFLLPYLDYVAIDLKGSTNEEVAVVSNTPINNHAINNVFEIINLCNANNILVDVRTVIFAHTDFKSLFNIANRLQCYDNVFWTLRKYNEIDTCNFKTAPVDKIKNVADFLHIAFPKLKIGFRDKWVGCNFYIPN